MNSYDKIKSEVNLVDFIMSGFDFKLDLQDSTKEDHRTADTLAFTNRSKSSTWILRKGPPRDGKKSEEKIGVSLVGMPEGGRWLYANNRNPGNDKGSVIDWVLNRVEEIKTPKEALVYVQKTINQKEAFYPIRGQTQKILEKAHDHGEIESHIRESTWISLNHPYLTNERHISPQTQGSRRFKDTVRRDGTGNAVFVHTDKSKITGYTLKNKGYESFSAGGQRSIWKSNFFHDDNNIIATESAIDALSYYQYHLMNGSTSIEFSRFVSIDGRLTHAQLEILQQEFSGLHVILAFDNDKAGSEYEEKILALANPQIKITREYPPFGLKDFNEIFQRKAHTK